MKKTIIIVFSAVILISLIFSISLNTYSDKSAFNDNAASDSAATVQDPQSTTGSTQETSQTETAPASPMVVLDAGHGGEDGGTVANGIVEKNINLSVCLKLRDILEKDNVTVNMTRSDDTFVGVRERADLANKLGADLLVSIHCNSFKKTSESGLTVFTKYKNRAYGNLTDEMFAKNINDQTSLLKSFGMKDRGVVNNVSYYLTTGGTMPSVLIELGFLTNQGDAALLDSDDFQNKLAASIAEGVIVSIQASK